MRRFTACLSMAVLLSSTYVIPALAGGRFFIGIGAGHPCSFFSGAAFSFHHHRSRSHFVFHPGHPRSKHFGLGAGVWGHNYAPLITAPFAGGRPDTHQEAYSGTDAQGAVHVNGYRVLPSGWLRIQVEPKDAQVLIDGFPVKIDPGSGLSASLGFLIGSHHVEVRKAGFQSYRSAVEVTQAKESFVNIRLSE